MYLITLPTIVIYIEFLMNIVNAPTDYVEVDEVADDGERGDLALVEAPILFPHLPASANSVIIGF